MHLKQTKLKITVTLNYKNLIQFGFVLAENINKVTNIGSVCQNIETGKASNACVLRSADSAIATDIARMFLCHEELTAEQDGYGGHTGHNSTGLLDCGKLCVLENEPPRARAHLPTRARYIAANTNVDAYDVTLTS